MLLAFAFGHLMMSPSWSWQPVGLPGSCWHRAVPLLGARVKTRMKRNCHLVAAVQACSKAFHAPQAYRSADAPAPTSNIYGQVRATPPSTTTRQLVKRCNSMPYPHPPLTIHRLSIYVHLSSRGPCSRSGRSNSNPLATTADAERHSAADERAAKEVERIGNTDPRQRPTPHRS